MNRGAPLVSSRWNPTPEQVQALEEMYKRGTRTPSAEQIQQIAAKLRRFGKIEGKNVFYWFQNHKARDRQKKRRQLELLPGKNQIPNPKQSGLSRKYLEIDQQPKKVPTMSKCSTASKYELELKQQSVAANSSTETSCRPLDLSTCMSPNVSMHKTTDQKAAGQENAYPFVALNLNKLLTLKNDDLGELESGIKENRTLELFPVRSSDLSLGTLICSTEEEMNGVSSVGSKLVPNQFFEFLPTKN